MTSPFQKKKLNQFRGTVSDSEVNFIKKLLPTNNTNITGITGAVSNKELNFLKKNAPKIKRRK